MAIFPSMLITHQGQTLYNKAQAGVPINFTKIKIGSGRLSDGQDQTILAGLIDYKFDVSISSITQNTQLQIAVISGRINNENITTGTYICELGLFADDPDAGEILYAYTNAADQGDYYAPAERGPFTWAYQINAAVGNAANVTATLVSNSTFDYAVDVSSTFTVITGINQQEVNESIDKLINKSILALEESTGYGVISGLTVSAQPTPDMTVNVATGIVHMPNGMRLTPMANSNLIVEEADVNNPRVDIIYVKNDNLIGYLAGTPASSPTAPDTPSDAFLLARINVGANVTAITNDAIVDMRKMKVTTEELDARNADYMYQIPQISGTQIRINRLSNTNRLFFKLSADLTGGAITISTDGGATEKPLQDIDGNSITTLEKGFVEVVADATFFTLRNKGISATQKQQLIDIVNNAETNQSTIKTNVATGLNTGTGSNLTSSSSWIDVQNVINNMGNTNKKFKTGTSTSDASGICSVSGLNFSPSNVTIFASSSEYALFDKNANSSVALYTIASTYTTKTMTVGTSSFSIAIGTPNKTYNWIARE